MDLADLLILLDLTDNDQIEIVAHNLAKGSRNHLRAFVRALAAQGETYTRQYLDQETFDAVLAADAVGYSRLMAADQRLRFPNGVHLGDISEKTEGTAYGGG